MVEQMLEKVDMDWYAMAKDLKVSKFGDVMVSEAKEKNKQIQLPPVQGIFDGHDI
ncbi:hypothetical protein [Serratia symbiotica]|uniref:hypothetical protein n=1 Tax=Serratia symbiotica TaxID=138074 RepID=UPI001F2CACBB|nr:hypothetical protein [Serratia symbiotica]